MKLLALVLVVVATGTAMAAALIALGQPNEGASATLPTQHVTMEVWPGDRIVGQNLIVRPGAVVLTIVNYARHAHTFSVPSLGVERVVLPASASEPTTTTVRFTALRGVFDWFCKLPCKHSMAGSIYAVSYRTNLHGPLWAQS